MQELKEVATIMIEDPLVPKAVMSSVSSVEMGHFAQDYRFKWRTA